MLIKIGYNGYIFSLTAVQGKLNELLDGNGGISKRKVSTLYIPSRYIYLKACPCMWDLVFFPSLHIYVPVKKQETSTNTDVVS